VDLRVADAALLIFEQDPLIAGYEVERAQRGTAGEKWFFAHVLRGVAAEISIPMSVRDDAAHGEDDFPATLHRSGE